MNLSLHVIFLTNVVLWHGNNYLCNVIVPLIPINMLLGMASPFWIFSFFLPLFPLSVEVQVFDFEWTTICFQLYVLHISCALIPLFLLHAATIFVS